MKYLRIDISKTERSCLYVKVPDNFDKKMVWHKEHESRIEDLIDDLRSSDWDSERDTEIEGVVDVTENEANRYQVDELIEGAEDKPEKIIDPNQTEMELKP